MSKRQEFIDGLRAVADFYASNPDAYYDDMHVTLNMYAYGRDARGSLVSTAKAMGPCNKVFDDRNVTVSKQFGGQVTLAVFAAKARVCKRVVVGTKTIPASVLPAVPEIHIPETAVEVVQWKCCPLLAGGAQ